MDFTNQLKQLGLPEREAKVLQFLLYSGDHSPSSIAKELGVGRSTVYDILNILNNKGLVIKKVVSKGKFVFQATSPKFWSEFWREQESRLQKQKGVLAKMLPDLEMLYHKSAHQPRVVFYEGQRNIRRAALDSLNALSLEIIGYSSVSQVVKFLTPKFIAYYTSQKIKRHIGSRFVLSGPKEGTALIKEYTAKYYKNDPSGQYIPRYRLYHSSRYEMKNEIMIYDDKMVIINLTPPHYSAVLIQNKDIADSQRAIFEIAWRSSKPVN